MSRLFAALFNERDINMFVIIKNRIFIYSILIFLAFSAWGVYPVQANGDSEQWSVRMAESVMTRHSTIYGYWDYVTGTVMRGFQELWLLNGESKYFEYIQNTVNAAVQSNGNISGYNLYDYNLDEIKEGCTVLFLYNQTGEEKYKNAADLLRSQLDTQPRTSEGGFWHKQRYPWQMWLDGLYMGSPFLAEYGELFDSTDDLDDVVNQLTLIENHARDEETGLLYHGWDESKEQEWADPVTGCSPSFWGRAIGWYAMALVDVLDFLPESYSQRDNVIAILQRLAEAVSVYQDESTGLWWQVVDQGGREGNYLESSVSCMLVYALAKGVRKGYLDASYRDIASAGFQGILNNFIVENADGTIDMTQTCCTAGLGYGRDGTYEYYVYGTNICGNDGKAVGPFILASLEIENMASAVDFHSEVYKVSTFSLTNYPNPFNSSTKIQFVLSRKGYTELSIYNCKGEMIKTLVNGQRKAGIHTVKFDAGHLHSGVFFCHLLTEYGMSVKKLLYIK